MTAELWLKITQAGSLARKTYSSIVYGLSYEKFVHACVIFLIILLSMAGFLGGHRTTEREYFAEHLDPGHAYRARVCCYTAGGQSDVSRLCNMPVALLMHTCAVVCL